MADREQQFQLENLAPAPASPMSATPAPLDLAMKALNLNTDADNKLKESKKQDEEAEKWFRMKRMHDRTLLGGGMFANKKHEGSYMVDKLTADRIYLAFGGAVPSVGGFHVIPYSNWNTLENMMAAMQRAYKRMNKPGFDISKAWEGSLSPGFYVAAKCRLEREYHRAQIIKRLEYGNYEVKLLDYGEIEVVPINDIRYLLLDFVTLPFQAIWCSALIVVDDKEIAWTEKEGQLFRRKIFNKTLAIHFKQRFNCQAEKGWIVSVHTYDTQEDKVTALHVERQVLLESRGLKPTGDFQTDDFQTLNIRKNASS